MNHKTPSFFDAHSHGYPRPHTLVSLSVAEYRDYGCPTEGLFSVGIHPWQLRPHAEQSGQMTGVQKEDLPTLRDLARQKRLTAIGEAGFDRLKGGNEVMQEQRHLFEQQAEIAEEFGLPLVIHSVRSHSDVFAARKRHKKNPWLIHGFIGNEQEIHQCLRHEIRLSCGLALLQHQGNDLVTHPLYRDMRQIPLDFLFMETDSTALSIAWVYKLSAAAINVSLPVLAQAVAANLQRDFDIMVDG